MTGRIEEDDTEYVCDVNVQTYPQLAVKTRSKRQQIQDILASKSEDTDGTEDNEAKPQTDADENSVTISDDEDSK